MSSFDSINNELSEISSYHVDNFRSGGVDQNVLRKNLRRTNSKFNSTPAGLGLLSPPTEPNHIQVSSDLIRTD